MIRVFFMGGLGNQMFQYAVARHLEQRTGGQLCFDLSWYYRPVRRRFLLGRFGIRAYTERSLFSFLVFQITRRPACEFSRRTRVYRADGQMFDAHVLELPDPCTLIGHFQSEAYFADIAALLRADFSIAGVTMSSDALLLQERLETDESVCIHVRRGDFLKHRAFNVCSVNYYRAAIEHVRSRSSHPVFFFFSDDPEWCRSTFAAPDFVFPDVGCDAGDPVTGLRLMASCRHHILSNSSLCWWAAWLMPDHGRIVVYPELLAEGVTGARQLPFHAWVQMTCDGRPV